MTDRTSDPLRILMVCSATSGTYGAVRSMMTLSGELRSGGHDVRFVTFAGRRFGAEVRALGYSVNEVRVRSKLDPLAVVLIAQVIRRHRIDVVHAHLSTSSVNGAFAAKLARVPSIATVHGLSGKLSYIWADQIIAVAESGRQHLIAQGVAPEKVRVVLNGVDRAPGPWPTRSEARDGLGLAADDLVVLTTGRVTPMKGVFDGIDAMAKVKHEFPHTKHILLGDGDAMDAARVRGDQSGLGQNLILAGYQSDIRPYLAASDIFLFPSLKEALPMSIIEAMHEGLPVVSSDAGGIPEIVTSETGFVVPVGQPDSLATSLLALARDPELRRSMGERGKARAETVFSAAAMADNTERVYRLLADRLLVPEVRVPDVLEPVTPQVTQVQ